VELQCLRYADGVSERNGERASKVRHLHELIDALDRRVPSVERIGEIAIAREGRALRANATQRIVELESEPRDQPDLSNPTDPSDVANRQLARRLGF